MERATTDKMWVVFVLAFPSQLLSVLLAQKADKKNRFIIIIDF